MTMCITSLRCTAHSELDTEPPKHHHHLERSLLYISLFSILAEGLGHPTGVTSSLRRRFLALFPNSLGFLYSDKRIHVRLI